MLTRQLCRSVFAIFALFVGSHVSAALPSHFTAAKHESSELRFIEGLPVVTVGGTPEEMGQQLGTLLKQPVAELLGKRDALAKGFGLGKSTPLLLKTARFLLPQFPEPHRRELTALAKTADVDLDTLVFGTVMYELSCFPACSTLAVEPNQSTTGGALFGRNLDFPTFGFLDQYSVVIVYHPQGKHAFASMSFPGYLGVASGMNDAGLCVAQLEVNESAESVPRFNLAGTPVCLCFRRLLEECTTVDEAEKLLREQKRLIMCNVALCDRTQAAVLEVTPKTVVRRAADRGLCACTNHFRTAELAVDKQCSRYTRLNQAHNLEKVGITNIAKLLDAVNQGRRTMQTMIFEPATLKAHVSFGPLPSSSQPLTLIDLGELMSKTAAVHDNRAE